MAGIDQRLVIEFLSDRSTYGAAVSEVKKIETHISVIFLAGTRAYKMKRAVRYPYLDFSTLEKRHVACEAEIAVNRRTAPAIYLGVTTVRRRLDGRLALGGDGAVVEWLVEMARFDEHALLDRLADAGKVKRRDAEDLADTVAALHLSAEPRLDAESVANLASTIETNASSLRPWDGAVFEEGAIERLTDMSQAALAAATPLLEVRRLRGFVRRSHGDLHLGNVCVIDGRPVPFDAIEFNDAFAVIDILYDAAFPIMDFDCRCGPRLANIFMNRYLDSTWEPSAEVRGVVSLLPLFLSLRAAVRAHVGATAAAAISDKAESERRRRIAQDYFVHALGYLAPLRPRLIAVGGLSGSGKSRLARELAPLMVDAPGARVVRSDAIRKRLAGKGLLDRLGPENYGPEMTERTYAAVMDDVRAALAAGRAVVADAVFARPEQRDAVARAAVDAGVPFDGLWLEAPPDVLADRIATRKRNVSDATADVMRRQLDYDVGVINWKRIDSGGSKSETLARGRAALGL